MFETVSSKIGGILWDACHLFFKSPFPAIGYSFGCLRFQFELDLVLPQVSDKRRNQNTENGRWRTRKSTYPSLIRFKFFHQNRKTSSFAAGFEVSNQIKTTNFVTSPSTPRWASNNSSIQLKHQYYSSHLLSNNISFSLTLNVTQPKPFKNKSIE